MGMFSFEDELKEAVNKWTTIRFFLLRNSGISEVETDQH